MRRRRRHSPATDEAEVPLSPLIDCVFLLLIFFLVTTIIKRKEKQIQVNMPETASAVAAAHREVTMVIGLDRHGSVLAPQSGTDADGSIVWHPVADLAAYLKQAVAANGQEVMAQPLQINAHRQTPFQQAINALDICKLQGFSNVSVKIRPELQESR